MSEKPTYTAPTVCFDKETDYTARGADLTGRADGYFNIRVYFSGAVERRKFFSADGKPINPSD